MPELEMWVWGYLGLRFELLLTLLLVETGEVADFFLSKVSNERSDWFNALMLSSASPIRSILRI